MSSVGGAVRGICEVQLDGELRVCFFCRGFAASCTIVSSAIGQSSVDRCSFILSPVCSQGSSNSLLTTIVNQPECDMSYRERWRGMKRLNGPENVRQQAYRSCTAIHYVATHCQSSPYHDRQKLSQLLNSGL